MGWTVKDTGGSDYEPVPEGTHLAICYMLVDLGWQPGGQYAAKEKYLIGWELPDELMKDGRPLAISSQYTQSLSEKANLRHVLEAWRGRKFTQEELDGFQIQAILGKPCMVTVTHTRKGERTYANVSAVTGLPARMPVPTRVNDTILYSVYEPDPAVYQKLPEWIRKKCDAHLPPPAANDGTLPPVEAYTDNPPFDDDIPF